MREVSDFEKRIYNQYLRSLGKAAKRPSRSRQNFDGIADEHYIALKKLSPMLANSDVNIEMFFDAPFIIHPEDIYQRLAFYLSPKAVKCYTMVQTRREKLDADSDENIEYVRHGLKFVLDYCLENNLTLEEYKQSKTETNVPMSLLHLKQHKINFYIIHALDLQSEVYTLDVDWLSFFIPYFESVFRDTKVKFNKSAKLKPKAHLVIGAIKNKLEKEKR